MLGGLKNWMRRRVRGVQRAGQFPLLLPHHRVMEESEIKRGVGVSERMRRGLDLCDGTRTLGEGAQRAGVAKAELIEMQDRGAVLIWHSPVPAALPKVQLVQNIIVS